MFAAGSGVDGDAGAEAREGLPGRLLVKLYWTVKSIHDRVLEREQLQLAALAANPHCHSNISFLDGAGLLRNRPSRPSGMGIDTLARTDHDGLYGVLRFAEAAEQVGVRTAFDAACAWTCAARRTASRTRPAIPILVLARGLAGYRRLNWVPSSAHLRGREKGRPGLRPGRDGQQAGRARPGAHRQPPGPRPARPEAGRPGRRRSAARPAIGRVTGRPRSLGGDERSGLLIEGTTSVNVPRYRCRSRCGGVMAGHRA
jgi:hypothetical protein